MNTIILNIGDMFSLPENPDFMYVVLDRNEHQIWCLDAETLTHTIQILPGVAVHHYPKPDNFQWLFLKRKEKNSTHVSNTKFTGEIS